MELTLANNIATIARHLIQRSPDLYLCQLLDEFNGSKPLATEMLVEKISDEVFGNDLEDVPTKLENFINVRVVIDLEVLREASRRFRKSVID